MHRLYLVKGVRGTTAIEGNTLSEEQIAAHAEGRLDLPSSQEYLKTEVDNVLEAVNDVFDGIMGGGPPTLTPDWIAGADRRLLEGLEDHLEDGVVPREIPAHPVGVLRYRGAPREDCAFLLGRLCEWLEGDGWPVRPDRREDRTASAILRAVYLHLYLAWIHPFGDGNGRTARLGEFMILAREGVPSPCAHLLSNHYNLTRAEYNRQLDRSSRANSGRGDPLGFLLYSLRGFVDGLREQARHVADIQLGLAWEHFVYGEFRRMPSSTAMRRRREVALVLGRSGATVSRRAIPDLNADLARSYAQKTGKTLTRDMNWLVGRELLERGREGYRAKVESMRAFQVFARALPKIAQRIGVLRSSTVAHLADSINNAIMKREKLRAALDEFRRNPAGVRFRDLARVCDACFGEPRQRGGGHRVYRTPWPGDPRVNIQNAKGMAKAYRVRQVIRAVERLGDMQ